MTKNKANELKLIRVFDAPVETVWDAWTDPEQVAQWWGPRGFTITTHSKDLRVGGNWDYTMHGPDGTDYPNVTKYLEVEKHKKLVYDHGGTHDKPAMFRVTVLFSETARGKTKMDMTMALPSAEALEETRKIVNKHGGNTTWDRLAEFVGKKTTGEEEFVINRTFDAPLDLLFDVWTKPEHLSKWLAPAGTMEFVRADIRTGGTSFYSMTMANGMKMFGSVTYLKIEKPHLVYTQQFCDEHEKTARHPMSPTWPETMLTNVLFAEEGPDRTRVTITWKPRDASREEIETFVQAKAGMTMGWTGSLDKLEAYIEKRAE